MVNYGTDILTELQRIDEAWNGYEKQPEIDDILINPTERAADIRKWQKETNAPFADLAPRQAALTGPDPHNAAALGVRIDDLKLELD